MDATNRRLAECQSVIGYYFSDPRLLETALTHSSLRSPDRECNERLEFLGDSILGLVITEELYHMLPDQSEGELTRIKSAVVSRSALLATSQRLGLPRYAEFARGVGKRDRLPASVVANLVEAVIGAIYLDAGYYPAREFVLRHMVAVIDDELNDRGAKNYKSLLQHEVQQSGGVTPTYRTLEADGPDHAKEFVVAAIIRGQEWGRAAGTTKKDAEQDAARKALKAWERRGRGRRRRRRRKPLGEESAPVEPEIEIIDDEDLEGADTAQADLEVEDVDVEAAAPVAPESPRVLVGEESAADEPAPDPAPEPAPAPAPEPVAEPVPEPAPEPPAPPVPDPAPQSDAAPKPSRFAAGIDVADDDGGSIAPEAVERAKVEAPSRKPAPAAIPEDEDAEAEESEAGFASGLV